MADAAQRRRQVVSLVPSSTETLLALGADVVACTRFCEQPSLRHVGGTKNPDIDAIVELAPDVVVLDREENRIEDHDALLAAGIAVVVSEVTTIAAGLAVVGQLAAAAGVSIPAIEPIIPRHVGSRRSAFVPIWRRPWMTIGDRTYGASVLDHLGIDVLPRNADPYPRVELADIIASNPELVLVPSEPYAFRDEHVAELTATIPDAHVVRVDGQDLFWWGIRTPEAICRLRSAVERPLRTG